MTRISTLMAASALALGTSAFAQSDDPAFVSGPNESGSSAAAPGEAQAPLDGDASAPAPPAADVIVVPRGDVQADSRLLDRAPESDSQDAGSADDNVAYVPVDPASGSPNDEYSGA